MKSCYFSRIQHRMNKYSCVHATCRDMRLGSLLLKFAIFQILLLHKTGLSTQESFPSLQH